MTYTLGARDEEQERLLWQSRAYGDLEAIAFKSGETVIEAGCGVGANLWIVPEFSIGSYIGFDISKEQIAKASQIAQSLSINNARLFVGDILDENLLDKGIADTIFIRLVLIHLKEPERALKNLMASSKAGGRVLAIEPDSYAYTVGPNMRNLQRCWQKRCELAYGPKQGTIDVAARLDQIFSSAGISQVRTRQHLIEVTSAEEDRMRKFLNGWMVMIKSVASQLIEKNLITQSELDSAIAEVETPDVNTVLHQYLTICEGVVG
ncbi:MAG: methyltransferase domain-containing protein [Alphaproteobacteria bacterium]|nr:methyltransferase domain-containing protein [Alphaproteobacteria bacterium]